MGAGHQAQCRTRKANTRSLPSADLRFGRALREQHHHLLVHGVDGGFISMLAIQSE
jgi:hypothetical protein